MAPEWFVLGQAGEAATKDEAETLMTRIGEAEDEARLRGEHWNPPMTRRTRRTDS